MSEGNTRVAIVGGGICGLTVRRSLMRSGFTTELFDKGRSPGGRMSRRQHGEYQFDHGAQYFTVVGSDFQELVNRWDAEKFVTPWTARIGVLKDGDWTEARTQPVRYVGVPAMNAPAKALAADADGEVHLQCRITDAVREQDGSWSLTDDRGRSYSGYRFLVITIPPAQALEILQEPTAVRATLGGAVVDPCWAVMAVFDPPLGVDWDAAFVQKGPLAWVARNGSKPGRPEHDAWVLHATPDWSRQFVEQDRPWVAAELLQAFGHALGRNLPAPAWSGAHRWRYARPRTQVPDGYLWDAALHLGLCGDWCVGGRLEGAFTSGRLLAEQIRRQAAGRPSHAAQPS